MNISAYPALLGAKLGMQGLDLFGSAVESIVDPAIALTATTVLTIG